MGMVLVPVRISPTASLEHSGQSEIRELPAEIRKLLRQRLYLPEPYPVLNTGCIKNSQ